MLGALRSPRELSLPGLEGPSITAPTYFCRFPGISAPAAKAAPLSNAGSGQLFSMTSTPFDGLTKPQLRAAAGLVRRDAARRLAGRDAELITRQIMERLPLREQETVAGYWPVRGEADPRHALRALQALGHRLALPVVVGKDQPLAFRSWRLGEPLLAGRYGIPAPGLSAPLVTPTLLLVPGLWFDRAGGRLGYGGGFYDRTLEHLRAGRQLRAVGIAYEATLGGHLDREPHDAVMDFVVTERRVLRTG